MHAQKQLRAMVLLELCYRLGIGRGHYETRWLIWQVVFGDEVPPPPDLAASSEANPYMRAWAVQ